MACPISLFLYIHPTHHDSVSQYPQGKTPHTRFTVIHMHAYLTESLKTPDVDLGASFTLNTTRYSCNHMLIMLYPWVLDTPTSCVTCLPWSDTPLHLVYDQGKIPRAAYVTLNIRNIFIERTPPKYHINWGHLYYSYCSLIDSKLHTPWLPPRKSNPI